MLLDRSAVAGWRFVLACCLVVYGEQMVVSMFMIIWCRQDLASARNLWPKRIDDVQACVSDESHCQYLLAAEVVVLIVGTVKVLSCGRPSPFVAGAEMSAPERWDLAFRADLGVCWQHR